MKFLSLTKKKKEGLKIGTSGSVTAFNQKRELGGQVLRDWSLVIASFVLFVVIVAGVDGYLLFMINRGDFFKADSTVELAPDSVNRKKLADVEEFFASRKKEYAARSATTTPEIDPSL
jgi:hypothetical protein